ncbi:MAG: hypothetical protein FWD75_10590 [Propionibacteriaceae bacterium]|nr:hypothetical protein [Propionibacteriaceae bacterium]
MPSVSLTPSPVATPVGPACASDATTWVSVTLATDAGDINAAVGVISYRVDAAGVPANVHATDGSHVVIDVCEQIADSDLTWMVGWVTHAGDLTFHQVLAQATVYSPDFVVPGPGTDSSDLDPVLADKLGWRPTADEVSGVHYGDVCPSDGGWFQRDPVTGTGFICDSAQQVADLLGPTLVDGMVVGSADAVDAAHSWLGVSSIAIGLEPPRAHDYWSSADYLMSQPGPRNQLAMALDGVVISSPVSRMDVGTSPIAIGVAGLTEKDAPALAAVIATSQTPMTFDVVEITHR